MLECSRTDAPPRGGTRLTPTGTPYSSYTRNPAVLTYSLVVLTHSIVVLTRSVEVLTSGIIVLINSVLVVSWPPPPPPSHACGDTLKVLRYPQS